MSTALADLEWKILAFFGGDGVGERTTDDTFNVVDGVAGVGGNLRFGGGSDELSFFGEGDPGGAGAAGGGLDDFYFVGLGVVLDRMRW
jgi:hypothetical protein